VPHVEVGDTWLSAPWLVAKFYAYRCLMEAIRYYDASSAMTYQWDLFAIAKRAGLTSSVDAANTMLGRLMSLPHTAEGTSIAVAFALWGNRMDLSIWLADIDDDNLRANAFADVLRSSDDNLLHNDTHDLANYCMALKDWGDSNIDIIVDNTGFELVSDLALADHLVSKGWQRLLRFDSRDIPRLLAMPMGRTYTTPWITTSPYCPNLIPMGMPPAYNDVVILTTGVGRVERTLSEPSRVPCGRCRNTSDWTCQVDATWHS
jgi:hypothetical protein